MEWVVGLLAIVAVMFIALYRKSLRENRNITHFALMVLIDPIVYQAQRDSLIEFVRTNAASTASDLGMAAYLATGSLANKMALNPLAVAGLLWQLRTEKRPIS
jgi:hypothetical protein